MFHKIVPENGEHAIYGVVRSACYAYIQHRDRHTSPHISVTMLWCVVQLECRTGMTDMEWLIWGHENSSKGHVVEGCVSIVEWKVAYGIKKSNFASGVGRATRMGQEVFFLSLLGMLSCTYMQEAKWTEEWVCDGVSNLERYNIVIGRAASQWLLLHWFVYPILSFTWSFFTEGYYSLLFSM